MNNHQEYGIHWFRRDLRITANPALAQNVQRFQGRTLGIFCFDEIFLARKDFSHHRFALFLNALKNLKEKLREKGGDLLFLDRPPKESFTALFSAMTQKGIPLPELMTWNEDYEPFARKRDQEMEDFFFHHSVETKQQQDHLWIHPTQLHKENGEPYKVYTPFSKKWLFLFSQTESLKKNERLAKALKIYFQKQQAPFNLTWSQLFSPEKKPSDALEKFIRQNNKKVNISIPDCSEDLAIAQVLKFKEKVNLYDVQRDYPAQTGTSRLAPFLKNGTLTLGLIAALLDIRPDNYTHSTGGFKFFKELIWREFYYHILYHFPRVENEAFLPHFKSIPWKNNLSYFEKWKEGQTGFPIVDAAMRELKTTGRMHNRSRMITASFLTKDLLIDWRWGEQYFMEQLLDGDLAPNNGGWQWAASTGCDPQPYFRIFNPWLQSAKFDPQGEYIKRFVPELKDISPKELHTPQGKRPGYVKPLVDHKVMREKALNMYKQCKSDFIS